MPTATNLTRAIIGATALSLGLTSAACSTTASQQQSTTLQVVTSFYPVEYVAKRIGGDRVDVANLTQPGAEPHDLELTPRQVTTISQSAVTIYLKGFQTAVDEAVRTAQPKALLDVAPSANLDLNYTPIEDGELRPDEAGTDPHFWLDPLRLAKVSETIAETLSAAAPNNREFFSRNLQTLKADLATLDREFATGLKSCNEKNLVTSHNAFGYLARKYQLAQLPISGLAPEAEPNPQDLARVAKFVSDNSVSTIYSETLINPATAKTIAAETGATTAVLDPLEGLSDNANDQDYFSIMRTNLSTLRTGQSCR